MVTITRVGPEALDQLEPLWLHLHRHHRAVGGEALGPYVGDASSWRARRELYRDFLENDGFALLAHSEGELLGYAMVAVNPVAETQMSDTWRTGDRIAEIETLSVAPHARGAGIGSALLDRVDEELEAAAVGDVVVGAFITNTEAIRLYERRGFRPAWMTLQRLGARSA